MRIPDFLVVAQWALLLALSLLVIIMYRQLARVFRQTEPTGDHGPPVGNKAAAIEYVRLRDDAPGYFVPGTQPALVAFVEPSCLGCEKLVAAINTADDLGDLAGLQVLLLMSDPPKYIQVSAAFKSTRQEIGRIVTRATIEAYHAVAAPLLVAIDASGIVQAAGAVHDLSGLRSFIQKSHLPAPDSSAAEASAVQSTANRTNAHPTGIRGE